MLYRFVVGHKSMVSSGLNNSDPGGLNDLQNVHMPICDDCRTSYTWHHLCGATGMSGLEQPPRI